MSLGGVSVPVPASRPQHTGSPFYAESGGQVGDTGQIRTTGGAFLQVTGTRPGLEGFHVHTAHVVEGEIRYQDATGPQASQYWRELLKAGTS